MPLEEGEFSTLRSVRLIIFHKGADHNQNMVRSGIKFGMRSTFCAFLMVYLIYALNASGPQSRWQNP